jgi:hypothetical protein
MQIARRERRDEYGKRIVGGGKSSLEADKNGSGWRNGRINKQNKYIIIFPGHLQLFLLLLA